MALLEIVGSVFLIFLFPDIILAVWSYLDCKNRGESRVAVWSFMVFILPVLGISLYVALRPSGKVIACANCKRKVLHALSKCPHCGVSGKRPATKPVAQQPPPVAPPQPAPAVSEVKCPHCNSSVKAEWKTCPYCSKKIEVEETIIDEVFLIYKDGCLIKHFTRRLKPDVDQDILSGMLTAVQSFVKDAFRGETGELDEMKFGRFQILIGRGRFITVAAVMYGDEVKPFRPQITKAIDDIEGDYEILLRDWDGDVSEAAVLSRYINDLIDGRYA